MAVNLLQTNPPATTPSTTQGTNNNAQAATSPNTLQQLAQQIAIQDGLTGGVVYNAPTVTLTDVTQHDHSDAYLLYRLCSEKDFGIKIVNSTIYITDRARIDALLAIGTFVCATLGNVGGWNGSGIEEWTFREETEDTNYSACNVSSHNTTTGITTTGTANDPNVPNGPIYNEKLTPHSSGTDQQDDIDQESDGD